MRSKLMHLTVSLVVFVGLSLILVFLTLSDYVTRSWSLTGVS